jgi:hypothetical protein
MSTMVIGITLFGMILGQFFKCFVLIPACGLAIVLVLINPAHSSLLGLFVQIVLVNTCLQIGYFGGGLATHNFRLARMTNERHVSRMSRGDARR